MLIETLELRNFKSWEHSGRLTFAPITAFFGANSSGKTSFLQSLLLLKQTAESADRGSVFDLGDSRSLIELGTFHDVLFRHDSGRTLGIDLSWTSDRNMEIVDTTEDTSVSSTSSNVLALGVDVTASTINRPTVEQVRYSLGDQEFRLSRGNNRDDYQLESTTYPLRRVQGKTAPLPRPNKFYGFPDRIRASYQNAEFLSDLELAFQEMCGEIHYLGPLRNDPQRQYIWSGNRPSSIGKRGEYAVAALIASNFDGNRNHRSFVHRTTGGKRARTRAITVQQNVAEWLRELGLIHSFSVQAVDERGSLYQVRVRRSPASTEVLLTDVGFGVSQVLPVLVLLAYVPDGSVVLLEQPEIHLHPAVQSGLADVLIEVAKVRNVQVIVESHSEHLLLRLQRRIAEEGLRGGRVPLAAEDCALYFCDTQAGRSVARQLELDLYGNITNWPEDFFGDSLGEAAAMTIAASERSPETAPQRL